LHFITEASNFTTSVNHAAAGAMPGWDPVEFDGIANFHVAIAIVNHLLPSAPSDNSKSPQDAAIRYEPAAAVKTDKTTLRNDTEKRHEKTTLNTGEQIQRTRTL
jgi:hypothetical protein